MNILFKEEYDKKIIPLYKNVIEKAKAKITPLITNYKIKNIECRIKKYDSLVKKMEKNHIPLTKRDMEQNITDIAGIRIVCFFIADVYKIMNVLTNQKDFKIITVKDYISNPKESGYRSVHLIFEMPIYNEFMRKEKLKFEIQIRTAAMDFWSSLEHDMKYKRKVNNKEIIEKLKECAAETYNLDKKMEYLNSLICKEKSVV